MSKGIIITARDHNLLVDIYDLLYVDNDYIHEVYFPGKRIVAVYKRTKLLEENGYIKSFRLPLENPNPRGQSKKVYTLDRKGVDEVRELLGDATWSYTKMDRTPMYIYHALRMARVKAAYKIQNEGKPVEIYEWFNEQRAFLNYGETANEVVRPDGMLVFKSKATGGHLALMFELERSRQRKEVSRKKLKRFNDYCAKLGYKKHHSLDVEIPAPRVVFVSDKDTEMHRLIDHVKGVNTKATAGVLFTTYEKILEDPYGKIFYVKDSKDPNRLYFFGEKIEF